MKNCVNQILLAAFFLTAALYVFFLMSWLELIPSPLCDPDDPLRLYQLRAYLGLGFHAVPCFFLQLLVCRAAGSPWVRLIPVFLLLGATAWFLMGLSTATGWDNLGWGILLLLCIAPAVGYGLAWAVYGAQRLRQHINE